MLVSYAVTDTTDFDSKSYETTTKRQQSYVMSYMLLYYLGRVLHGVHQRLEKTKSTSFWVVFLILSHRRGMNATGYQTGYGHLFSVLCSLDRGEQSGGRAKSPAMICFSTLYINRRCFLLGKLDIHTYIYIYHDLDALKSFVQNTQMHTHKHNISRNHIACHN